VKNIEIDTAFGDRPVHIEISAPSGAGNSYQVMVNKYYNGEITKTSNHDWQIHLSPKTILHGDDVSIIIDLIEDRLPTSSQL
jgi:hypothetical protein